MSIPLFLFFSVCLLFEIRVRIEEIPRVRPVCSGCEYSLEGLPDRGVCPECGLVYEPLAPSRQVESLAYRPGALTYWAVCVVLLLVFEVSGIGRYVYGWGVIQSYLNDGYRLDVATNAAFLRELSRGGGYFGEMVISWWIGCTPLIGLMARGRARYTALAAGTLGFVLAVFLAGL